MTRTRRQALGQHFLVDEGLADRIVGAVGATAADLVCEIGAGPGILTERLAARAGRLVALEIDPELHRRLAARAAARAAPIGSTTPTGSTPAVWTIDVRLADARTFPYETLIDLRPDPAGRVLIVGNLPYSASKPILFRLFEARSTLDALTLMLQQEVAERLTATPGGRDYGALSVLWQVWADLVLLERVPPEAFRPPPAVESAVIQVRFRRAPQPALDDPGRFVRVVKVAFAQRRKTLWNALRSGFPAPAVAAALLAAGVDGGRRAESLGLEEFAELARFLGRSTVA
jgi:16S rRNA (adenine1518-N6/adenine1519-N6)-dimethyltransferase